MDDFLFTRIPSQSWASATKLQPFGAISEVYSNHLVTTLLMDESVGYGSTLFVWIEKVLGYHWRPVMVGHINQQVENKQGDHYSIAFLGLLKK